MFQTFTVRQNMYRIHFISFRVVYRYDDMILYQFERQGLSHHENLGKFTVFSSSRSVSHIFGYN